MITLTVESDGSIEDVAKAESLAYNLGVNVVFGKVTTTVLPTPAVEVPTPVFTPVFTTPESAEQTNG